VLSGPEESLRKYVMLEIFDLWTKSAIPFLWYAEEEKTNPRLSLLSS
jgi:hypothetical protein